MFLVLMYVPLLTRGNTVTSLICRVFPIFMFYGFVITKNHPDGNAFAERPFFAKYSVYVALGEVL